MVEATNPRIGFVGAGVHARANLYASLAVLGVPIRSVATRNLDAARSIAAGLGGTGYDDYVEMFKAADLDAVFVVTESGSQAAITKAALAHGLHVFVEKALGMDEREAADVAEAAAKAGKHVMVGFMKRFAPSYSSLRDIARDEVSFGRQMSFTGMFGITSGRPGWDDEVFLKVGGVHYVDLMRHMFGEASDVVGYSNGSGPEVDQVYSLRFDSGVVGNMFFAGLPSWRRHWEELTVTGVAGFAKVNNMLNVTYHLDAAPATKAPRWQTIDEEDRILTPVSTSASGGMRDLYLNGYVGEVEHFLECIVTGATPLTSAADNVKTMALCDSMLKSLR